MKKSDEVNMKELEKAILEINKEDDIEPEFIVETVIDALKIAYKEHSETEEEPEVIINSDGMLEISVNKKIVEKPENPGEITLKEAKKLVTKKKEKDALKVGDDLKVSVNPKSFGRIAAQRAKQIVFQRIREREKDLRFEEYTEKLGEIVTGLIQKAGKLVIVDIGNLEAVMPEFEQIPTERYEVNQKIRVYIKSVRRGDKDEVQVMVSRADKDFVKKLFEYEIPELDEGLVEIKSVARDPGKRTKIAAYSSNPNIDPVGTLVGQKGIRIQNIINELSGERIDVVEYSEDPMNFISSALLPAEIRAVDIDEDKKFAQVIVSQKELVPAIGKGGQNVKLASALTGYKIDIKTEEQFRQMLQNMEYGEDKFEKEINDDESLVYTPEDIEEERTAAKIDLNEKAEEQEEEKEEDKNKKIAAGKLSAKSVQKEEIKGEE